MKRLAFVLLFPIAACTSAPVASDFDEDSVTIQSLGWTGALTPEVTAEAARLCAINGREAVFLGQHVGEDVSTVSAATGVAIRPDEFEFACVVQS